MADRPDPLPPPVREQLERLYGAILEAARRDPSHVILLLSAIEIEMTRQAGEIQETTDSRYHKNRVPR